MQRWIDRLVLWCQPRGTHSPRPKSTMIITLSRPLEEYDGPPELLDSTEQRERVTDTALDGSLMGSPALVALSTGVWGLKSFAPKLVLRWLKRKQSPHSKEPKPGIIQSSMTQVIVSGTRPTSDSTSGSTELKRFGSTSLKFALISRSQTLPPRFGSSIGSGIGISKGSSFLCPGRPKSSKKLPAAIENSEMERHGAEPSFTLMPQEDVNGEAVLLESGDQIIDDEESKIQ
ncbi:hypothetical protein D915_006574 [Fasciola hepatica]|uniref:Uncharacterized protein n=1 Tax=Fasciola hepatica TaxID=6192 RepID=A0A4E0RWG2_FASHE|nr:hypothetical protein D915_006574 [Fasciola hepatica]